MTKEQEEAIERINNDIAKPLWCGDITICNIDDLKTVLSMLEEKDNIITQLIDEIYNLATSINEEYAVDEFLLSKETIKEYFYKKVEDKR